MLWSGRVSRVGASHRVNPIAPFPLGQNCPRKNAMSMSMNSNMSMFNNKLPNNKVFKVAGKSFQHFEMGHCKHFSSVHATVGVSKKKLPTEHVIIIFVKQ